MPRLARERQEDLKISRIKLHRPSLYRIAIYRVKTFLRIFWITSFASSDVQQFPRLGLPRRGSAVLGCGDARQRHQVPPTERRARVGKFLRNRPVKLLRV